MSVCCTSLSFSAKRREMTKLLTFHEKVYTQWQHVFNFLSVWPWKEFGCWLFQARYETESWSGIKNTNAAGDVFVNLWWRCRLLLPLYGWLQWGTEIGLAGRDSKFSESGFGFFERFSRRYTLTADIAKIHVNTIFSSMSLDERSFYLQLQWHQWRYTLGKPTL